MKKLLIILSLILLTGCAREYEETTTPYNVVFEFYDDYKYNLNSGGFEPDTNFAVSSKESVYSNTITLTDYTKVGYLLMWNVNNAYSGYYTISGNDDTKDGYLGNYNQNTITIPDGVSKVAIMTNKTGLDGYYKFNYSQYLGSSYSEVISGKRDNDYVLESIDDYITVNGFTEYTYRDIFGDSLYGSGTNNEIENGDFNGGYTNWAIHGDTTYIDNSISYNVVYGNSGYLTQSHSWAENHNYFLSFEISNYVDGEIYLYLPTSGNHRNYGVNDQMENKIYTDIFDAYGDTSLLFNRRSVLGHDVILTIDNVMLFDLTSLFTSGVEPTKEQFEEMLSQYERITQFGNEYLYLEDIDNAYGVYENPTYDSGNYSNFDTTFDSDNIDNWELENLIINGSFTNGVNDWKFDSDIENYEVIDGVLHITQENEDSLYYYNDAYALTEESSIGHLMYINFKYNVVDYNINAFTHRAFSDMGGTYNYYDIPLLIDNGRYNSNGWGIYSNIVNDPKDEHIKYFGYWDFGVNGEFYTDDYFMIDITNTNYYQDLLQDVISNPETPYDLSNYATNNANNPNFSIDTNSDGIADGWYDLNDTLINNDTPPQYIEADTTDDLHSLYYNDFTDYDIGDYLNFHFDIADVGQYYSIVIKQKGSDGVFDTLHSSSPLTTEDDLNITVQTTDKYSSPNIIVYIYLMNEYSETEYIGDGNQYLEILEFGIYNVTKHVDDYVETNLKPIIDDQLSYYKYWEGSMIIPDYNDLTNKYIFEITDNGFILGDTIGYYYKDSLGDLFPTGYNLTSTNLQRYFDIYYLGALSYGTNYDYINAINPSQFGSILNYEPSEIMSTINNSRDYTIELYQYYLDSEDRWDWYGHLGITNDNYSSFMDEYNVQLTENVIQFSQLNDVSISGDRVINVYEQDDIDDFINDRLDGIGASNNNAQIFIMLGLILITLFVLVIKKSSLELILFAVILQSFVFYAFGWISGWIILLIGMILLAMVLLNFFKKRGGEE